MSPVSYTHLDVYKRQIFIRMHKGSIPGGLTALAPGPRTQAGVSTISAYQNR